MKDHNTCTVKQTAVEVNITKTWILTPQNCSKLSLLTEMNKE